MRFTIPNHAIEKYRILAKAKATASDLDLRNRLDEVVSRALDAGRSYQSADEHGKPNILVPLEDELGGDEPLTAVLVDDANEKGRKCIVTMLPTRQAMRKPRPPRATVQAPADAWLVVYTKAGREVYVPVARSELEEKLRELVEVEHVGHSTLRVYKPIQVQPRLSFEVEGG
jgi:hypothetical protein